MTNLSVDSRDTVAKPISSDIESEPMEVLITFNDGARFQFRILVPVSLTKSDTELASWFSEQTIIPAHEFSRRVHPGSHAPDLCVSESATFINMANVSQIRELPL